MKRVLLALMLSLTLVSAGCIGGEDVGVDVVVDEIPDDEPEPLPQFPAFDQESDDGTNWTNERMDGAYIVIFSAEWCNSPCYSLMHTIWETEAELPVIVFSTDPDENAGNMNLSEWHESANEHDDEGDETGVTLSSYIFMKGVAQGEELGIDSPGTCIMVNAEGEITYREKSGTANDPEIIAEQWAIANGTAE